MKGFLLILLFCFILLQNLSALTLGVVPQQNLFHLLKVWHPIVSYLEKETGEKIQLKIAPSIPAFEKLLYSGQYDLAYMNPYHYVLAHKKGYKIAVRAEKKLVGIVVVKKTSSIKDFSHVEDKSFLFPSPDAFAATLLVKYELFHKYGIDINTLHNFVYVNSHDSVYKGVARDIGDFGGGVERTFNNLDDNNSKNALRILYKTQTYPSHPFAYKSSMPKKLQEKFTKAFLNMPNNLLDSLNVKKFILTDDKEYDSIRNLINKLSLEED